ncbi:MAG: WD40 repeat domain-containing protein, partial [Caldilineaceae bacterium]|nr:WD40 repeat domain-containing protein [Caldilineaceae bacterium]
CLLLTSRERPRDYARLERDSYPVHSLQLSGLDEKTGYLLLKVQRGIEAQGDAESQLIKRYSGNPLALKLVADTVDGIFGGDIGEFLADDTLIFDDIRTVLDQHFARLTDLEQQILFWLAVEREPIPPQSLRENLLHLPRQRDFLEALRGLQRHSLVERQGNDYTLLNVVTEYVTERLVEFVIAEIVSGQLNRFHQQALLKAQAKEYVRESQMRLLLTPIGDRLLSQLGRTQLKVQLQILLDELRQHPPYNTSYAGGNLLNLLLHLKMDVTGYDFSTLHIRQAYLKGAKLPSVNFTAADFPHTAFTEDFGHIFSLAISPRGAAQSLLAAGGNTGEIRLWRLVDTQPVAVLRGHQRMVPSLAFSPDGEYLASVSMDRTLRVWSTATGQEVAVFGGSETGFLAIAFSPDGELLASGDRGNMVRLWHWRSGQAVATLKAHGDWVHALAFHPTQPLLASGSHDGAICLWRLGHTTEPTGELAQLDNPATDQPIAVTLLHRLHLHTQMIWSLAFHPDGTQLASGSGDQTIRLWDVASGELLQTLHGHTGHVRALLFTPDGKWLISGGADHLLRVWNLADGRIIDTLRGHTNVIWSIALSGDGTLLASGGVDDTIRLWHFDPARGSQALRTLHGFVAPIHAIACDPRLDAAAPIVTGDGQGNIRFWSMAVMESDSHVLLTGHKETVVALLFTPDGSRLASASTDGTLCIWDSTSGEMLDMVATGGQPLACLTMGPRGVQLVGATQGGAIYCWEIGVAGKLQLLHTVQQEVHGLHGVAFHPQGEFIATTAADGKIRLWQTDGKCVLQLVAGAQGYWSVAFDAGGAMLAAASRAGMVAVWDMRV